jgi:hypothetical protein
VKDSKKTETNTEKSGVKVPKNNKLTKPTLISIIVLGILFVAGIGAAAYTQAVLNNPDRIWDDALQNTKSGFEEVSSVLSEATISGGNIKGTLNIESPVVVSSSLEGSWSDEEAQILSTTSITGVKLNSELIAVNNEDDNASDIYLKIDGLDSLSLFSELLVPGSRPLLQAANNNWYKLQSNDLEELSQIPNELDKIDVNNYDQEVGRFKSLLENFLYNADDSQNVVSYEPVGREDFNGNDSYKYKVTINESRSQEFLNEIGMLIEESELSSLKDNNESMESLDIDTLLKENDDILPEIEVWVDMSTRYFRNVRLYIPQDTERMDGYIDIGLDYKGGDEMPFYINLVSDTADAKLNLLLTSTLNIDLKVLDLGFDLTAFYEQQPIRAYGTLNIVPGEASVEVEAPKEYESIDSLIEDIGLLGILNPDSSGSTMFDSPFILDDVEL